MNEELRAVLSLIMTVLMFAVVPSLFIYIFYGWVKGGR